MLTTPTGDTRTDEVLTALRTWNKDIPDTDRQTKYCKMASAPLVFYRGTNHLFWADFAGDQRLTRFGDAQTRTWLQGDLHVYNYGSYDNDKDEVVYDLNDFDEAIIADYQYDLWRMAVSIVLVARQNGDLSMGQLEKAIDTFSQSYLDTLNDYRKKKKKKVRTLYFTKDNTYGKLGRFLKSVERAYSREGMLNRWTVMIDGERRFDLTRSKLEGAHVDERTMIHAAMTPYRKTLTDDPAKKKAYFNVKDVARRLKAGIGSLGTRRFYVLIEGGKRGDPDDDRILDVKRQTRPTAYKYLGKKAQREYDERYENDAQRHAKAYRMLTRHTDNHLGWMHLDDGYYSVRERSAFKEAFPGEALDTRTLSSELAEQWAEILATDHTRANEDLPKRLRDLTKDQEQAFLDLVREVTFSYADIVEADWNHFRAALDLQEGECDRLPFAPPSYRNMLAR